MYSSDIKKQKQNPLDANVPALQIPLLSHRVGAVQSFEHLRHQKYGLSFSHRSTSGG